MIKKAVREGGEENGSSSATAVKWNNRFAGIATAAFKFVRNVLPKINGESATVPLGSVQIVNGFTSWNRVQVTRSQSRCIQLHYR